MPTAKVMTKVSVRYTWDYGSSVDYKVSWEKDTDDGDGPNVYLDTEYGSVRIYPEAWPLIKQQIDKLFNEVSSVPDVPTPAGPIATAPRVGIPDSVIIDLGIGEGVSELFSEDGGYLERLQQEKSDLETKIDKLQEFIDSPLYTAVSSWEAKDLKDQHKCMDTYSELLAGRIYRALKIK